MIFKKKKTFYERQLELWEAEAEKYQIGSPEWQKAYNTIGRIHQDMKDVNISKALDWKKYDVISKTALGLGGLGLGVAKLVQYWKTAKLAYGQNKQMNPKDGEVWKLKDDFDKIKV